MKSKHYTLEMTELQLTGEEREWLKALVQNPIGVPPENEDEHNRQMRKRLWAALTDTVNE